MEEIKCINCNKIMYLERLEVGTNIHCDCGCLQRCLYKDDELTKWRVLNPFSFEDKRNIDKNR